MGLLFDFSEIDASTGSIEWMHAVDNLTKGVLSITLSLLLFGLIYFLVKEYYEQKGEQMSHSKSLFSSAWISFVLNLFFVFPIKLVNYKVLFIYMVLFVVAYVQMKRDNSS